MVGVKRSSACLLLKRCEFKSRWGLQFLLSKLLEANEKEAEHGPFKNKSSA